MSDEELAWHYTIFKRLALLALVGLVIFIAITVSNSTLDDSGTANIRLGNWEVVSTLLGGIAMVPFVIHAVLVSIWHWKARYKGEHSRLWGALLVIEVSGWFKIIYLLRHFIPDARKTGRYV
jgi:hypothetical protein